jgi:hypothetical protein
MYSFYFFSFRRTESSFTGGKYLFMRLFKYPYTEGEVTALLVFGPGGLRDRRFGSPFILYVLLLENAGDRALSTWHRVSIVRNKKMVGLRVHVKTIRCEMKTPLFSFIAS